MGCVGKRTDNVSISIAHRCATSTLAVRIVVPDLLVQLPVVAIHIMYECKYHMIVSRDC